MYEIKKIINICEVAELLKKSGLDVPVGTNITLGIYKDDKIIATGSLKGKIIQGLAVDSDYQGEDLTAKIVNALMDYVHDSLYLFTKTSNVRTFEKLGFKIIANARPYAALLEQGNEIEKFKKYLRTKKGSYKGEASAVVVNCNPFTLGHRYLIETAHNQSQRLYVIVVEEDVSEFPFELRYKLVKKGVEDLDNVVVLKGSRYAVSSLTFPAYFTKEENIAKAGATIDCEIFCNHIASELNINKRFIGTEPISITTNIYNQTLKEILPQYNIEVIEIERKKINGDIVSASRVRALLSENNIEEVRKIVPKTTFDELVILYYNK